MKKFLATALLIVPFAAFAAGGADSPKPAKSHHHRGSMLGQCSKQAHAKGLHGPERRKFISACIAAAKRSKTEAESAARADPAA